MVLKSKVGEEGSPHKESNLICFFFFRFLSNENPYKFPPKNKFDELFGGGIFIEKSSFICLLIYSLNFIQSKKEQIKCTRTNGIFSAFEQKETLLIIALYFTKYYRLDVASSGLIFYL